MTRVYIGIGSNIDPELYIEKALDLLKKKVEVTGISSFYLTKPIFNKDINDFVNGVCQVNTALEPEKLKFDILKKIEKKLHRKKTKEKYSSRTIDLDLILYGNRIINTDKLKIPDPDIYTRAFISIPLYELDPKLILPDTGKYINEIINNFNTDGMTPMNEFSIYLKKIIKNTANHVNISHREI